MTRLTLLVEKVVAGEAGARDELFAEAYDELRQLARARLRHGGRNSVLQTTSLVHESYLRFLNAGNLDLHDRRAFFAYASRVMRSTIIDSVREHRAERRGGGEPELTLETDADFGSAAGERQILAVHDALLALEAAEPRLAKVVEMRYFGGYSEQEIGQALDLTERTVRRDWSKARLMLAALLAA